MEKEEIKSGFNEVLRGAIIYVVFSIFAVFIFALILKSVNVNENTIKWINQFLKIMGLFCGCFFSLKEKKGLIKGIVTGIFGAIILYIVFSVFGIIKGSFLSFLVELLFMAVFGALFGIIAVNSRKKYR